MVKPPRDNRRKNGCSIQSALSDKLFLPLSHFDRLANFFATNPATVGATLRAPKLRVASQIWV